MDELKILVEMVADLPAMALWVIAGFFIYKVVIVGSIYGVIKLAINQLHGWATTPREEIVQVTYEVGSICISSNFPYFMEQLKRLKGIRSLGGGSYIHDRDVDWLAEAINEKLERESKNEQ